MKKLLVLTALIGTVSCTSKKQETVQEKLFEPKFTIGQQVTVQKGFLRGQLATIIDATRCVDDGQGTYATDVVCYTIRFKLDEEVKEYRNVSERELEP